MKPSKRKVANLSIQTKMQLLKDYDKKQLNRKEIAMKYGIAINTISCIIKNRGKIEDALTSEEFQPERYRQRRSNKSDVDRALFAWYKEAKQLNTELSTSTLTQQAERILSNIGTTRVTVSPSWICRFKRRHGISFKQSSSAENVDQVSEKLTDNIKVDIKFMHNDDFLSPSHDNNRSNFSVDPIPSKFCLKITNDEDSMPAHVNDEDSMSAHVNDIVDHQRNSDIRNFHDVDMVTEFDNDEDEDDLSPTQSQRIESETKLASLLQQYQPDDVFIADETGLFFRHLPHGNHQKRATCSKGQLAKDRLTLLVAANMTGKEKLPLLVVGRSSIPCNAKIKSLPVEYKVAKKAWITACIFQKWVQQLDKMFEDQGRSILLILDNNPVHDVCRGLKAIQIVSLLSGSGTSYLPPCTLGIFSTLKCLYRTLLTRRYLSHLLHNGCGTKYHISLLDTLFVLRTAWDRLEKWIIAKAFRLAGFGLSSSSNISCASDLETYSSLLNFELNGVLERLNELKRVKCAAESYASIDEQLETSDWTSVVKGLHLVSSEDESDSDENTCEADQSPVTMAQAMVALQTLQQFALEHERGRELFSPLGNVSEKVGELSVDVFSQPKITSFFKRTNT